MINSLAVVCLALIALNVYLVRQFAGERRILIAAALSKSAHDYSGAVRTLEKAPKKSRPPVEEVAQIGL